MNRKAAVYDELETKAETLTLLSNKTVTIDVGIDPDNGTFELLGVTPTGDIWPGDKLVWSVSKITGTTGTLAGKTLKIELPRIDVNISLNCTSDTVSLTTTLPPKPLSLGVRRGVIDGNDGPTNHVGAGHKLTLGTQLLTRPGARLVIDTSGPPAGGGGGGTGGGPCPDPDDGPDHHRHHDG